MNYENSTERISELRDVERKVPQKIALIGLSGVGRSTCVIKLCPRAQMNFIDMDCGLGTSKSPEMEVALSLRMAMKGKFLFTIKE